MNNTAPSVPDYVSCPNCVEGKITAGCAIDKPLISVDCDKCHGTGRIAAPSAASETTNSELRRIADRCDIELRYQQ